MVTAREDQATRFWAPTVNSAPPSQSIWHAHRVVFWLRFSWAHSAHPGGPPRAMGVSTTTQLYNLMKLCYIALGKRAVLGIKLRQVSVASLKGIAQGFGIDSQRFA